MTDQANIAHALPITPALEDYLETIFELIRDRKIARVRDIAKARDVKAGSVTPALRRLADLGLVRYEQREFIELTPEGEAAARRIFARHQVLTSFFEEVLDLPAQAARADACAMEHHLSDEAMDKLVRFFEYLRTCPEAGEEFLDRFHRCARVNGDSQDCARSCQEHSPIADLAQERAVTLASLDPGKSGRVRQVTAQGALRQSLLDKGMLPDARITVERVAPGGDRVFIRIGGYPITLTRREALVVSLDPIPTDPVG